MVKKIKRKKLLLVLGLLIVIVTILGIYIFINKVVVTSVPYEIYNVAYQDNSYYLFGGIKKVETIRNVTELNNLFENFRTDLKKVAERDGLDEEFILETERNQNIVKENLLNRFNIWNDSFFNNYFLIFTQETGSSSNNYNINDIIYNRFSQELNLIRRVRRDKGVGAVNADIVATSYFIKIDKKYLGNVVWKYQYY